MQAHVVLKQGIQHRPAGTTSAGMALIYPSLIASPKMLEIYEF